MEGQAVVIAFQGMDFKVVHGLGGLVREKAELDDLARLHGDDSDFLPFLGHFQLVARLFAVVLRGEVLLGDKGLLGIGGIFRAKDRSGGRGLAVAAAGQQAGAQQRGKPG